MRKSKIVKPEPVLKKNDIFVAREHKPRFAIDIDKTADKDLFLNKNNSLENNKDIIFTHKFSQTNTNTNLSSSLNIDFFEQPMIGFAVLDKYSKIKNVNKKLCDILGYSQSELIGKKSFHFLKTSSLKRDLQEFNEFILNDNKHHITEKPLLRKDGSVVYVEISGKTIFTYDGNKQYLVSVWDISQRKFLESNLINNEFWANTLINVTSDVITIIDNQGIIIECNNNLIKRLGKPKEEIVGKINYEFFPTPISQIRQRFAEYVFDSGQPVRFEDFSFNKYNDNNIYPIFGDDGKVIKAIIISHDITDKKTSEIKIRENEFRLRMLLEATSDGVWDYDIHSETVYYSPNFWKRMGYPENEIINEHKFLTSKIHIEDIEKYDKEFTKQSFGTIKQFRVEFRLLSKSCEWRWILSRGKILEYDVNLKPSRIIGTYEDITEEKIANKKLFESEELYRLLADNSTDLIMKLSSTGQLIYVSPASLQLTGYQSHELIGKNIIDYVHYNDRISAKRLFIKSSDRWVATFRFRQKCGKYIWIETTSQIIHENHSVPDKYICVARDITIRKNTQDNYLKQKGFFEAVAQAASILMSKGNFNQRLDEAIKTLGGKLSVGKITIYSKTNQHQNEYTSFKKISQWFSSHNINRLQNENDDTIDISFDLMQRISNGESILLNYNELTIEDQKQFISLSNNSILLSGILIRDKFWGFIIFSNYQIEFDWIEEQKTILKIFSSNIGSAVEHKIYEEKLAEEKEFAERSNRTKSEFLANMSHEIRTPMTSILGFGELLLKSAEPNTRQQNYLNIIYTSGKVLLRLINDILDLSRIEAGKMEIIPEIVDIEKALMEVSHAFSQTLNDKKLIYNTHIPEGMPKKLLLDSIRFRQILFNLVGNAVKFTEKGSVKVSFNYKYTDETTIVLTLEIDDTGIGIPKDALSIIFEPFSQNSNSNTRQFGGTGLGLAITKRFVEKMNGIISVDSVVGKGSKFKIEFSNIKVSHDEFDIAQIDENDSGNIEFKGSKVLVIDDYEYNRELVKGYLDLYNVIVLEAGSAQEGFEVITNNKPDLVLMDIRMPNLNGYEAVKSLKKMGLKIPVIAFTASVMKDAEEKISKRFDGYLRKPIRQNELISMLKKFLPFNPVIPKDFQIEDDIFALMLRIDELNKTEHHSIPQKIKDELLDYYIPLCKEVLDVFIIDDIENFSNEISEFSIKNNLPVLYDYSTILFKALQAYHIEKIRLLLNKFPILVSKLFESEIKNELSVN